MIGAGNGEEAAAGSLLQVDGRLGGGVVGCVGTSALAAVFSEAFISLSPAGTSATAFCCLEMSMAVSDGASGAVAATKGEGFETVVNTYKETQTEVDPQSTGDNTDPDGGVVVSLGASEDQSGAMRKRWQTNDGVNNEKRRIREPDNTAEAGGRTLGKTGTGRCATDIEAPRIYKYRISATVKFRGAVG